MVGNPGQQPAGALRECCRKGECPHAECSAVVPQITVKVLVAQACIQVCDDAVRDMQS